MARDSDSSSGSESDENERAKSAERVEPHSPSASSPRQGSVGKEESKRSSVRAPSPSKPDGADEHIEEEEDNERSNKQDSPEKRDERREPEESDHDQKRSRSKERRRERSDSRLSSGSPHSSRRRERSDSWDRRHRSRSLDRSHRERDRNRRARSESREHRNRDDSRDRGREHRRHDRERDRSRGRDREDSRERERDRHRDRKRDRSRERRQRSRSASRGRDTRRRSRSQEERSAKRARREPSDEGNEKQNEPVQPKEKKEPLDLLRSRAGGAYIPPAKLKMLQEQIQDKSSEQYQRMNWERLKKKIHGLVNKINVGNLVQIVRELLQENIIRGKGLLARSIIQAQAFSPVFSHVYAALVAVINSKFPAIGELILKRLIVQFKRSFRRNDKATTVTVSKFIAHLINQQVAHEVLALEVMLLMLAQPTEDSVEVAIAFLKESGAKLSDVAPRALDSVYERLRNILAEAQLDTRIRYMIEVAMAVRRDKFQDFPALLNELDLISEEDQITHTLSLEDATDPENMLNIFRMDEDFEKNETAYNEIREEIVGDADESDEESDEDGEGEEEGDADDGAAGGGKTDEPMDIIDNTEQNLVAFRREVYLTIQSSLDFQEAAHKLLRMRVKPELEIELCHMLVDCCAQQRTYERFYGLLCERFCRLKREFQATFETIARETYQTIHRFDITKLRNMARLMSHLLVTDAISWMVLSEIKLNEQDTTSSGRIYIKTVFQELSQSMGIVKLYERIRDPTLQGAFEGLFPRDNPANTRFAINFFTLIGLGGLTVDLREFLEKGIKRKKSLSVSSEDSSSESSSEDSSSDSSDSDSDSDSSSSDSSDSEDDKKKKRKKKEAMKAKAKKVKGKEAVKEKGRAPSPKEPSRRIKEEPLSDNEEAPRNARKRDRGDDSPNNVRQKGGDERRRERSRDRNRGDVDSENRRDEEKRKEKDSEKRRSPERSVERGRHGRHRDEKESRHKKRESEDDEQEKQRSRERSGERDHRRRHRDEEKTRDRDNDGHEKRSRSREQSKERGGDRSRDREEKENRREERRVRKNEREESRDERRESDRHRMEKEERRGNERDRDDSRHDKDRRRERDRSEERHHKKHERRKDRSASRDRERRRSVSPEAPRKRRERS